MQRSSQPIVISALIALGLAFGSPILAARDKKRSDAVPGSAPAGKILWQFNTNG